MDTAPAWKEFETLVFNLQKKFSQHASVSKDERIFGHNSKTPRQIDVAIRTKINGEPLLMVVECKRLAAKVDVKDVDAFASVKEDVRAHIGMMVSLNGFTDAAYNTAQAKNISLYRYEDTLSEGWPSGLETLAILNVWVLTPTHASFILSDGTEEAIESDDGLDFVDVHGRGGGPLTTLLRMQWDRLHPAEKYDRTWFFEQPLFCTERPEIKKILLGATSELSRCFRTAPLQFEGQVDDRAKSAKVVKWKFVIAGPKEILPQGHPPPDSKTILVDISTTHVRTSDPKSKLLQELFYSGVLEITVDSKSVFEIPTDLTISSPPSHFEIGM